MPNLEDLAIGKISKLVQESTRFRVKTDRQLNDMIVSVINKYENTYHETAMSIVCKLLRHTWSQMIVRSGEALVQKDLRVVIRFYDWSVEEVQREVNEIVGDLFPGWVVKKVGARFDDPVEYYDMKCYVCLTPLTPSPLS